MKWLLAGLLSCTALAGHTQTQSLSKALVVQSCGTPPPPGSPLSNLTMNASGRLCSIGGGSGSNMTTPLLFYANYGPQATATNYNSISSGSWATGLNLRQIPIPVQGTISGLAVFLPTAAGITTNYLTFALNINGTPTALQCSIGEGGVNLGTTSTCFDPNDVVHVNVGDLVAVQSSVPGGTSSAPGAFSSLSMLFTSENGQESLITTAKQSNISASAIQYYGFGLVNQTTTDELASSIMPTAGRLDHFYGQFSIVLGTASVTGTVFKNGVATSLVAVCSGPSPQPQCSDLTNSINIAPGDTISVQMCPSGAAGCPAGSAPPAGTMGFSLRFVPSSPNQAMLFSVPAGLPNPPAVANRMGALANAVNFVSGSDATYQNIAPVLPTQMTLGNLTVAQCPGPDTTGAGGVTRTFTLRANGVNQSPTVAIPGNSTAPCPTLAIARDTTDTYQASSLDLLNLVSTVNTVTNASTMGELKYSMTATVP